MVIDWNWFFSSFCQSAAALIGIIAAFVISRLLGLTEKINTTITYFDNLVIEHNRLLAAISKRNFVWYTKTTIENDDTIMDAIWRGEFKNLSRDEVLKKVYDADHTLYKDDDTVINSISELSEKMERPAQREMAYPAFGGQPLPRITPVGVWKGLEEERETINKLEIESQTLIRRFQHNLEDLNSFGGTVKPLRRIIVMIMISFPFTVLYPLHFMPMEINQFPILTYGLVEIAQSVFTLKFLLLTIFFCTIEGIFSYFFIITNELNNRLTIATQNNSDDLRNIKSYSKYFE